MKEHLTPTSFYHFKYVSDPQISPDETSVAHIVKCVTPDKSGYDSDLFICRDQVSIRLTNQKRITSFTWTPEGNILYLSAAEPNTIYQLSIQDGTVSPVFELPVPAKQIISLTPGKYAVLGVYDNGTARSSDPQDGTVTTLTEVPFWGEFGAGYTSGMRKRLYLYDDDEKRCVPITAPMFEVVRFLYADGKLAFIGMEYDSMATQMYSLSVFDVAKETVTELIPQNTMYIFGCAPFGEEVLFVGNESTPYGESRWDNNFYMISATGGVFHQILPYAYNVGGGNGTTDTKMGGGQAYKRVGDRFYFLSTQYDSIGLYSIDSTGDLRVERVEPGLILSFDRSANREIICGMYGEALAELYEHGVPITHFNDDLLKRFELSTPIYEEVHTSDGYDVHGWVLKPVNYCAGKQYPAILHIHGGPQTIFSNVFQYDQELWASNGYFVLFCNPRGSDGRGFDFRNITAQYGVLDYQSIMDWLDGVLERYPEIDQKRLGVTGGSYGGYMTNWIITQTDKFSAAVSQRSISDWITFEYTAIRGWWLSIDKFGTRAGLNYRPLWDASPLQFSEHCTTPTLFIQCDNDHVCWMNEALTMFSALKTAGCTAKLCLFHGEDHELSRSGKPLNRVRCAKEILEWFNQYLHPDPLSRLASPSGCK